MWTTSCRRSSSSPCCSSRIGNRSGKEEEEEQQQQEWQRQQQRRPLSPNFAVRRRRRWPLRWCRDRGILAATAEPRTRWPLRRTALDPLKPPPARRRGLLGAAGAFRYAHDGSRLFGRPDGEDDRLQALLAHGALPATWSLRHSSQRLRWPLVVVVVVVVVVVARWRARTSTRAAALEGCTHASTLRCGGSSRRTRSPSCPCSRGRDARGALARRGGRRRGGGAPAARGRGRG